MGYRLQQRLPKSSNRKQRTIEYSPSLLEKSLGFVRVFGLTGVPAGVRSVLEYALRIGDCTQEQINQAQIIYQTEYERNPLKRLFTA